MTPLSPSSPEDVVVEPLRMSAGIVLFIASLVMPAIAAVGIYLGAWLVAGDVYAAREAHAAANGDAGSSAFASESPDAAGWKKALVGICPVH